VVLLFHQAGSGRGEYATIAPLLAAAGYDALAIDQRSGGSLFGRNETAKALGRTAGFLEAERDLEAAFAWARARGRPVILWGSSYSAALVFRMAARHPRAVKAVLAFSPGEYLGQPGLVRSAAGPVTAPVFVTSSADPGEVAAATAALDATRSTIRVQHVPTEGGVHGSSTLIPAKNPRGADANWRAVMAFLTRIG
jgi:alpha-beta hydrolase superfamily lysophospholipase